jgi:hypothetical protein
MDTRRNRFIQSQKKKALRKKKLKIFLGSQQLLFDKFQYDDIILVT